MGAVDRHYALRHPIRWIGFYWPHMLLATVFFAKGWVVSSPLFADVAGFELWPPAMWLVGCLVLASALAPLHRWLQAVTGSLVLAIAVFRSLSYAGAVLYDMIPSEFDPLALGLTAHWVVLAAVGAVWPRISAIVELRATTRAGREVANEVNGQVS